MLLVEIYWAFTPASTALPHDQPGLRRIADIDHDFDLRTAEARHEGAEILGAGIDRLIEGDGDLGLLLQQIAQAGREPDGIVRALADQGDLLAGMVHGDEIGQHLALAVVTPGDAEEAVKALLGNAWVGREGDLDRAVIGVDRRGRQGHGRAPMADQEIDLLGDQLGRDRHGHLGVAAIILDDQLQLLAEHAAMAVDVLDRGFGAGPHLVAERRIVAGHRAGQADQDIGPCRRIAPRRSARARHSAEQRPGLSNLLYAFHRYSL